MGDRIIGFSAGASEAERLDEYVHTDEDRILQPGQRDALENVRAIMNEVRTLASLGLVDPETTAAVESSIEQLDDPFLLVVVGEFNAGKSALINALLGEAVLTEGVTPTTTNICVLRHADQPGHAPGDGVETIVGNADLLRDIHVVDTPGTNAITREHEALTSRYVPRADLILFTTSADRPFTESERRFMERIREWGKKVVVVINKIDILGAPSNVNEVVAFVRTSVERLLSFSPELFAVSAKLASEARQNNDPETLAESGLSTLQQVIFDTLDDDERFRLKLLNPVGVGLRFVRNGHDSVAERRRLLKEDAATVETIETLARDHAEEISRGLEARIAEVDVVLHRLEKKGHDFFEETLRIGRLVDLLNRSKLRADFEREVIGNLPQQIETRVQGIIDWLVTNDFRQWQQIRECLVRRRTDEADRAAGELVGDFERDRRQLLDSVGRAVEQTLDRHDHRAESARMADAVRGAIANAALLEVGAVGLGTVVSLLASSTAVDVTGTLAAGLMATLGFFVIPRRRRLAKKELGAHVAELREQLGGALHAELGREVQASAKKLETAVAPYLQFVEDERSRIDEAAKTLDALETRLEEAHRALEPAQ